MYYTSFTLVAQNITPLFFYIILGYVGGKALKLEKESFANFLFYIVNPIVFFHNMYNADLNGNLIAIPLIFYGFACFTCLLFYRIGKLIWKNDTSNLLGLTAGTGNIGYMMLPLIYVLFGEEYIPMFFLMVIGLAFFENTLGFYISASGTRTPKDSILKLLKLPSLYTFTLGIIFSIMQIPVPDVITKFNANISSLYSIFGMLVIGLNMASIRNFRIDFTFVSLAFGCRFIFWPFICSMLVLIDQTFFHAYSAKAHSMWMVTSFIPLGVNPIIVATILKNKPEKIATAVLISTITALFYIPFIINIYY